MPGMTNSAEVGLLDHTLGSTPWSYATTIYACFLSADPTDAGTQTSELGRNLISSGFDAASAGVTQNSALESIPTSGWSGSDSNDIAWVGFAYNNTTGPYFWTGQLTNPINWTAGETLEIAAGGFIIRLNAANTYAISDNARNKWLDHLFGTTQWSPAGTPQVRLHSADPGSGGTLNEFTGGSYTAQNYTAQAPVSGDPTTGTHSNALQYLDNPDTTLDYWTIHRGTDFMFGRDQTNRNVSGGSTVDIPAGRLVKQVA